MPTGERVSFLLWSGILGGAETSSVALAGAMRALSADARVVFVTSATHLEQRVEEAEIPYVEVGLERGRDVLRHPRKLARVASAASDTIISMSSGYLAGALRVGGFRGRIVAVEHGGALLQMNQLSLPWRVARSLERRSGIWTCSAEIAVSEFVADRLRKTHHPARIEVIPNGVDTTRYVSAPATREDESVVVACAGRLIPGKGFDDAIRAVSSPELRHVRLRIAGAGPARLALERLARELRVENRVELTGPVLNMPSFWQASDIALVPSNTLVESFGMTAVEAMATGRPVIASTSGALPEVVGTDGCGTIYEAGDLEALTRAITAYAADPVLRARHGAAARARCERRFAVDEVARRYLALLEDLRASS